MLLFHPHDHYFLKAKLLSGVSVLAISQLSEFVELRACKVVACLEQVAQPCMSAGSTGHDPVYSLNSSPSNRKCYHVLCSTKNHSPSFPLSSEQLASSLTPLSSGGSCRSQHLASESVKVSGYVTPVDSLPERGLPWSPLLPVATTTPSAPPLC
jgi:hypothetical protein